MLQVVPCLTTTISDISICKICFSFYRFAQANIIFIIFEGQLMSDVSLCLAYNNGKRFVKRSFLRVVGSQRTPFQGSKHYAFCDN